MTFPYIAAGALISSGWGTVTSAAAGGGGGGGGGLWDGQDEASDASLPTTQVDVTYTAPTGGTLTAANLSEFTTALATAASAGGNRIISITDDFSIPATVTIPAGFDDWVYIMSDSFVATPPVAANTRATTSNMTGNCRTLSLDANYAIRMAQGATKVRFVGLWFLVTNTNYTSVLHLGAATQSAQAHIPSYVGVDRCIGQGPGVGKNLSRLIWIEADNSFVHSSTVYNVYRSSGDCQAINIGNCNGPVRITNNTLESEVMNMMVGGYPPGITNQNPADIEVRFNHFSRATTANTRTKNNFEMKCGIRTLVEGNVLDTFVSDSQKFILAIKTSTEAAGTYTAVTNNVTIRRNLFTNLDCGVFNFVVGENNNASGMTYVTVYDNLCDGYFRQADAAVDGYSFANINGQTYSNMVFKRNTFVTNGTAGTRRYVYPTVGSGLSDQCAGFTMRDNVMNDMVNAFFRQDNVAEGETTLENWCDTTSGATFDYNLVRGESAANWTGGGYSNNTFPADAWTSIFAGPTEGVPSSWTLVAPFTGLGSNGSDMGCDVATLLTAISGVTSGTGGS